MKKKLFPKRFYEQTVRKCRCTHPENMHSSGIGIYIGSGKTPVPCRVCLCPTYKHMETITQRNSIG